MKIFNKLEIAIFIYLCCLRQPFFPRYYNAIQIVDCSLYAFYKKSYPSNTKKP